MEGRSAFMRKPRALVLTGYGINCDYETAHAFNLPTVGGEGIRVHLNDLFAAPQMLRDYQIWRSPAGSRSGMISPQARYWP